MSDTLLKWRDEFPILEKCTYLISNSLGAMPRGVYDSLKIYADSWATLGVSAWGKPYQDNPNWFELNGKVSDKIAPLMGAASGTVLVHQNASIANSILFGALDFSDKKRNKVVITDMDFPSDVYVLKRWLPEHIDLHIVKTYDGITIEPQELLDAIDENTRLVSISHVLFRSAYIMPAKEIVEKAHAVGAQVVFNGYHSVGIIPVNVSALNVDFYIGGVLKWICGGTGGVFMYIRPDLLNTLEPKVTGWMSHKSPFSFDVGNLDWREDNYRLMNGTPGIASLQAIQPGIDIMTQVGVDNIREKSIRQTSLVIELADEKGYEIISPRDSTLRAGTITLNPPHAYEISRELISRGFIVDYRANAGIRVAPHFYNSDEELRLTVDTIAEILEDKSWEKHKESRDFVT
jgi:kynureninase